MACQVGRPKWTTPTLKFKPHNEQNLPMEDKLAEGREGREQQHATSRRASCASPVTARS